MATKNDKNYKMWFLKFMSYRDHGEENKYDDNTEFTQGELLQILPADICKYMNFKCFHNPEPADGDTPQHARSSTLLYVKKSISHFMPRKAIQWDPITERGNPTRSEEVHSLIRRIKKFEVRRQGKSSQARRPLEFDEFLNLLDIVRSSSPTQRGERLKKYLMGAVLTMQWQLIARIDDMMKLKFENLEVGPTNFTLTCQMRWSKNITEERESPTQIILGSMDSRICPLLNMAVYIEVAGREHGNVLGEFAFDSEINGHRATRSKLVDMFESDRFKSLKEGNLGTHSIRKGASTYASRCGQSKDAVERRGRWRKKGRVVDVYIDTTLPYPDACTATALCGPRGACKYRLREGISLTEHDLTSKVAREISRIMGVRVGAILALPLLWAVFEDAISGSPNYLPSALCNEIQTSLSDAGFSFGDLNPVERVAIYPAGNGGDLNLIELTGEPSTEQQSQNGNSLSLNRLDGTTILSSQLNMLQRRLEDMNSNILNELVRVITHVDRHGNNINNSVKRIALQPVVRRAASDPSETSSSATSRRVTVKLSRCPRDLHTLWQEYEHGLGHTKPAKIFTAVERGANKFAFSRRKVFWDLVKHLVRLNYTSDTAIDYIYNIYGRGASVTKILLKLRADRIRGDSELGKW